MRSVRLQKAKRSIKALSRSLPLLVKKRTPPAVRYSPRGIGDERPNVRDARYTFPLGDEPVTLPMQPRGTAYLILAVVIAVLVAITAAASKL